MNRGAKIVIVAVVALFALTGIYYAFSSPKSRTTAARDTDTGGTDSAAGRISDPIAPGASVPQTLTMGPSTSAPGAQPTPPDAAFARPATGANPGTAGLTGTAPGASAQPGATVAGGLGAGGTAPPAGAPASLAPVIAPPATVGATPANAGTPRILPPERTAAAPTSPSATGAMPASINPPSANPTVATKPASAPAAPASTSYTIKSGDTLSTIAGEFYKDTRKWKAIADANPGIDPSRLKVGQVIKVPAEGGVARQATTVAERASAATKSSGSTHTVAKGETLAAIAERYLGSKGAWKKLYDANKDAIGSDPAKLKVGTKLMIPAA